MRNNEIMQKREEYKVLKILLQIEIIRQQRVCF